MTDTPASPSAKRLVPPGRLDTRTVVGVLLVLTCVILGARVLSAADRSETVWAAARDLAPGTQLTSADLMRMRVRLFTHSDNYIRGTGPAPTGYFLRRGVGQDELLPYNALTRPGADLSFRFLTVPVARGHLPPNLTGGSQVDVYVTPDPKAADGAAAAVGPPRLVVANVTVQLRSEVSGLSTATDAEPVLLEVRPSDVPLLLAAMSQGRIDLIGVPRQLETETPGAG